MKNKSKKYVTTEHNVVLWERNLSHLQNNCEGFTHTNYMFLWCAYYEQSSLTFIRIEICWENKLCYSL